MAWEGSTRKQRLPADWARRAADCLRDAGHRCQARMSDGSRCRDRATDADHIVPGDDHRPSNLQALCAWHHARKSSIEGNRARTRFSKRRPPERHPGLIEGSRANGKATRRPHRRPT